MADPLLNDLASIKAFSDIGGDALAGLNIARERDNNLATDNQVLLDRAALSPYDFERKYGTAVTQQVNAIDVANSNLQNAKVDTRNGAQRLYDDIFSIGTGINNSLGGAVTLAANTLSPQLGVAVAEKMGEYSDWANSRQSDSLQEARRIDAMRTELDNADNAEQFQKDRETDGDMVAGLKMFGRDAIQGIKRLAEDPALIETGVSEGVGSLSAGGPVAKALGLIGAAVTKTAIPVVSAMPAAIAVMEGGSAFVDSSNEVLDKTHKELMESSSDYRSLIENGMSQDAAKRLLAGRAGGIAAAIQAPVAAATGALVAKFEAAPTVARGLKEVGENIIKETIEEGTQSVTGELAGNIGVQQTADDDANVLEGVGSAGVQGAIFGSLTAGALQAPGTALKTSADLIKSGVNATIGRILENGDRIISDTQKASSVSEEAVQSAVQSATEVAPAVGESIKTLATEAGQNADEFINRVVNATRISPEETATLPEGLRSKVEGTTDRFATMAQMARVARDEANTQEDRTSAAIFLLDQINNNKQLLEEDIPSFLDNVSHENENYQNFENYRRVIQAIQSTPSIQEALNWAMDARQENTPVNDNQQIVNNTAGIARHNPQNINPEVASQVLAQADRGTVTLTPEQRNNIRSASSLVRAGQVFEEAMGTPDADLTTDIVNKQIETDGGFAPHQLSLEQHTRRINEAATRGNTEKLKSHLTDLALFARHMRNKVNAAIESYNNGGKKISYRTLGAQHRWMPAEKSNGIAIHATSQNSLDLAKRIHAEAKAVAQLSADLLDIYPGFAMSSITIPDLPSMVLKERNDRDLGVESETSVSPVKQEAEPNSDSQTLETAQPNPQTIIPDDLGVAEPSAQTLVPAVEEVPTEPVQEVPATVTPTEAEVTQKPSKAEVAVSPKVEPIEEASQPTTYNLENTYPDLIMGKDNFFKKAFKFPKELMSRLVQMANPLKDMHELLNNRADILEFMGKDIDYSVSNESLEAIQTLLEMGNKAKLHLNQRLKTALLEQDKTGKSLGDRLVTGENVARYVRGRVLNILDRTPKGFRYSPNLIETAIIAGLDWALTANNSHNALDRAEIAALLGVDVSVVTNADVTEFNRGFSVDQAKRQLADHIVEFWGVSSNNSIANAYTKGIPEAVAAEVLYGLQDIGLLEIGQITGNKKTFGRVWIDTRSDTILDLVSQISQVKNLIKDIALKNSTNISHIGKPPAQVAKKQLRSPLVNNTKQQRQAIEHAQNMPFFVNTMVHDFIKSIGKKNFMLMMGGREFSEGDLNINHEASVRGVNRTLEASYDNVLNQVNEVQSYADKAGTEVSDMPSYYEFNITRVGRLQMMGLNNPQSDKLAREIFMPTKTTLDLSNPLGDDAKRFWMTIGQGLGMKTAKLKRDQIMKQAVAETLNEGGKYKSLVDRLILWMDNPESSLDNISKDIADAMGSDMSMHGVHSLLAVAAYSRAHRDGKNLSNYTHYNYLEADGKTNGPINSLALLTTGKFTAQWLKLVAKGGFFIGSQRKTLNDHVQAPESAGGDPADLYETVTKVFSEKQGALMKKLGSDEKISNQFSTLMRVMSALNIDINFNAETNELVMKRGVAKNPLTISIYGSGRDGIAANVTNEIINVIYERITDFIDHARKGGNMGIGDMITNKDGSIYGNENFKADLESLTTIFPVIDRKSGDYLLRVTGEEAPKQGAKDFTFTPKQFNAFKSNIRVFFINQMSDAIEQGVLGNVSDATRTIQQATQMQSIILTAMFRNELMARLAEKELDETSDYKKGDFLSDNELSQIYSDLEAYSPRIETGTQTFYMSGAERGDVGGGVEINGKKVNMPEAFSRALDNTLSSSAYVYGPTEAGVRAVPSLVIGTGDGQMIQNILAKYGINGLPVFDGFNMPADRIDQDGETINKAVWDTWNENPLQHVSDSFAAFMRNNPLETLLDETNPLNTQMDYLIKAFSAIKFNTSNPSELVSASDIITMMDDINIQLKTRATEVSARQEVLRKVELSIDQMASAEAPYVQKGSIFFNENASLEEIAETLNNELINVIDNRNLKADMVEPIAPPDNTFVANVTDISTIDDSGALVTNTKNIGQLLDLMKLPKIHQEMMINTLKALQDNEYTIVFGSPNQLSNWQMANHPDRYDPSLNNAYGKIDPVTKTIYINNMSSETLVHELIHAATLQKTKIYYEKPEMLSKADQEAFARMEGLMQEWLLQNYDAETQATQEARRQAVSTINGYLNSDRPAEALNEFMAWSLSNQNIIEVQKKSKVKNSAYKIIGDALLNLWKLIWGTKFAPIPGDTLFSNLRFNARVILATPTLQEVLSDDLSSVAMYQSASFGSKDRISELRDRFTKRITSFIKNGNPLLNPTRNLKAQKAMLDSSSNAQNFIAHGFAMNMQEVSTFSMIQAALSIENILNPNSLSRIEDLYSHVIKNIKVEDFMVDPKGNNPNDRYQAQEKYDVLSGIYGTTEDENNRSSLMSSFLALAMVHDGFRAVLSKMDKPKTLKDTAGTLDAHLTNVGMAGMDNLAILMAGEKRNTENVQAALDSLVVNLTENVGDQQTFIEAGYGNAVEGVDNYIATQINNLSDKVHIKADEVVQNTKNPVIKGTARLVRFAASIINEDKATEVVKGVTSFLNQGDGFNTIREFVSEIVGRTKDNASVFDMISKVRAAVQQTRQQFREKLPEQIASKFTRQLTDNEWTALFNGLGKIDLASLFAEHGIKGALSFFSDKVKLSNEVSRLERLIGASDPLRSVLILEKAKQLAGFLNGNTHGKNLLRNAYAISHLYGERIHSTSATQSPDLINNIDKLVTLYALSGLDNNQISTIENLIVTEAQGTEYALSYLVGLRADETSKINTDTTRANHYKGHIPSENQLGVSLIVAHDAEHAKLVSLGFIRVAPYEGSSADISYFPKSYYFSPVNGRATYNQGVLQTVHQTVSGIDPNTGYSIDLTAGRVTDPQHVRDISRHMAQSRNTNENLLPVFDENGNIKAYERGIDPKQLTKLNKNTNLSEMIGAWRGRQAEEALANEFNRALITNLKTIWTDGQKDKRSKEFINLATSNDPVHMDTWKLIPNDVKDQIKAEFGAKTFMIRRDMLNDAVGFRSASVGDLWTGNTRMKPEVQKTFTRLVTGIFGNKAYINMVNSEKFVQTLVTEAKVLIVVKSIIVPAANLMSNIFQLLNRGVPLRNVVSGLTGKTAELNDYIKRRDRELVLEADLHAAEGVNNATLIRKIENELTSIRDSYKRMSIYPLIQAGEFSAISDGGITSEDIALANGKWVQYVENIANKVPDGLKTVARYALITRDTALFQGLTRSVQYGDFLGKAILYDDLINRKKIKNEDALAKVNEEFVNYNRLAGRNRNYLESIGLIWFWNFKLRSMKTAVSMMRENPLRSLMMANMAPKLPLIGSIGSPITDNFYTVLADGKLGYSIGPNMGLNSPFINPWMNLIR